MVSKGVVMKKISAFEYKLNSVLCPEQNEGCVPMTDAEHNEQVNNKLCRQLSSFRVGSSKRELTNSEIDNVMSDIGR